MYKFNEKYIHVMWNNELTGKTVFYAESIANLVDYTKFGGLVYRKGVATYSGDIDFPFEVDGRNYRFVYYDPCYELKVAQEQGKTIQYSNGYGVWFDMEGCEFYDNIEYRIKPDVQGEMTKEEKPVTRYELARWLSQGRGQLKLGIYTYTSYYYCDDSSKVSDDTRVRKWGDSEWYKPTREYMGLFDTTLGVAFESGNTLCHKSLMKFLKPEEFFVLDKLLQLCGSNGKQEFWFILRDIANDIGLSQYKTKKKLFSLEARGLITIEDSQHGGKYYCTINHARFYEIEEMQRC